MTNWYHIRFWMVAIYLAGFIPAIWYARDGGPQWPILAWMGAPFIYAAVIEWRLPRIRPSLTSRARLGVFAGILALLGLLGFRYWSPSYFVLAVGLLFTAALGLSVRFVFSNRNSADYRRRLRGLAALAILWAGIIGMIAWRFGQGSYRL